MTGLMVSSLMHENRNSELTYKLIGACLMAQVTTSSTHREQQLPLRGVPFADQYRVWKIREVVFQVLAKEYELAEAQAAKEIPTVKVLDAKFHRGTAFPPRLLIMITETFF